MAQKTYTLREYLDFTGETPHEFAEKSGIKFATIRSVLEGYEIRYSSCVAIEEFTRGAVPYTKLAPTKLRKGKKSIAGNHQEYADRAVS